MKPWNVFGIVASLLVMTPAAHSGDRGIHFSLGGMAFMNSTQQGGQGPQGSTILSQAELLYLGPWWGIGMFTQLDRQGSNELDLLLGPKIELHWGPFYIEGGYAALLQRTFTDRTIARQSGVGWITGIGTRFSLGGGGGGGSYASGGGGGGNFFLQFSYKYRIQQIYHQDGVPLSQPIIQMDAYPLFGIGYRF